MMDTPIDCAKLLSDGQRELVKLNLQKYVEKKGEKGKELSYLSWSYAWKKFLEHFPLARYVIEENEHGLPYFYDEGVGYIVKTRVFPTADDSFSRAMWLPVMDGANKAMKKEPYSYTVKRWDSARRQFTQVEKQVEAADMFDINKTIMRCLVKNLAMFGLGIYIYAGEDLPDALEDEEMLYEEQTAETPKKAFAPRNDAPEKNTQPANTVPAKPLTEVQKRKIRSAKTKEELKHVCRTLTDSGANLAEVRALYAEQVTHFDCMDCAVKEALKEEGVSVSNETAESVRISVAEENKAFIEEERKRALEKAKEQPKNAHREFNLQ